MALLYILRQKERVTYEAITRKLENLAQQLNNPSGQREEAPSSPRVEEKLEGKKSVPPLAPPKEEPPKPEMKVAPPQEKPPEPPVPQEVKFKTTQPAPPKPLLSTPITAEQTNLLDTPAPAISELPPAPVSTPESQPVKSDNKKHQFDTLVQFASVELKGSITS